MKKTTDIGAKLLEFLLVRDDAACWPFLGCQNRRGYGKLKIAGKSYAAHRVAYAHWVGEIPEGLHVLHACDNPSCCNPGHLFAGTHQDNMADRGRKGRTSRRPGEECGLSKLTEAQAIAIKQDNRRQAEIAADYGITQSNVSAIKRGISWRHLGVRNERRKTGPWGARADRVTLGTVDAVRAQRRHA